MASLWPLPLPWIAPFGEGPKPQVLGLVLCAYVAAVAAGVAGVATGPCFILHIVLGRDRRSTAPAA